MPILIHHQKDLIYLTVNKDMTIAKICDAIKTLFTVNKKPVQLMSNALLLCSALKRPGLSTILSVANIVKDLEKLGIPTGPMPDGSPNLTVAMTYAIVNEVYRAMREDAVTQSVIGPGSLRITVTGANAGGPFTAVGTNVDVGSSIGIMSPKST